MLKLHEDVQLRQLVMGASAIQRPFLRKARAACSSTDGVSAEADAAPLHRAARNARTHYVFKTSTAYSIVASDRSPVDNPSAVAVGTRFPTLRCEEIAWMGRDREVWHNAAV